MLTPDLHRSLKRRVDALDSLVREVAQGPWWPLRRKPPSFYVSEYVTALLAILVTADGEVSVEELGYLRAAHDDTLPWEEEVERSNEIRARLPTFDRSAPGFFVAACTHDRAHGTHLADRILGEVDAICELMMRADSRVPERERAAVTAVLRTLRTTMQMNGDAS